MNILAIDTSSAACVIGVEFEGRRDNDVRKSGRSHSRDILPTITALLRKNKIPLRNLNYIVYGQGPGSFTGLRIAVGVVQGLAFGLNIPVVPVSSLACLAQAQYRRSGQKQIVSALHARKEEVYLGLYQVQHHIARIVTAETVTDVKNIKQKLDGDWVGAGDGWILREQLEAAFNTHMTRVETDVYPEPDALLDLGIDGINSGRTIRAVDARPEYLREEVASFPGKKQ